ncbi:hypothetical protein T440DRAFT_495651 [Plenodomus tracheiphilus IPT5]|uniref:Serine-rich protein n=1 Tax=Plenodomus tracheiphilus IPT5 TaxID=1408161 RepID=A0A6A7BID4_9PLEO|nr:hypothetical protein T440DRAFT_495651 [Plenodomus tracheiphilus IPT5]
MSSSAHHRRASSQGSIASVLSQAPKFPPPRPRSRSGNASPSRKPLHERSHSQTNQRHGPTIRIVQDPDTDVYSKYPVPTEPSQILAPPRNAPGYGFERPGSRVSSGSQVANTIAKFEATRARTPQPILSRKKGFRHSTSTNTSEADTLVNTSFSPSSLRFSQGSTPPSSPSPQPNEKDWDQGLEVLPEEVATPHRRPTIRAVPPSSSGGDSLESRNRALTPKTPAAPPVPAADYIRISNTGNPSSVTHGHTSSLDSDQDPDPQQQALRPQTSFGSIAFSEISYTSIEPTFVQPSSPPSSTLHEAHTVTFASGTRIDYPIVRAPTASSLRTDPQNTPYFVRMQDRSLIHQWSSQLSTIQSVSERDSRSIARNSRSLGARSHSQESLNGITRTSFPRQRAYTIESAQSSIDNVSYLEGNTAFSALPRPFWILYPPCLHLPLRMKNSGYLRKLNGDGSVASDSRPGSSNSDLSTFIHNNIPTWAKVYYQRGERISVVGAPESESSGSIRAGTSHSARSNTPSDGNFPLSIYRPRNRPRNRNSHADTMSLSDEVQHSDGSIYVMGPNMHPLSGYSTPHLRTDQRGHSRYGIWKAPSLDADLNTTLFGRQNRQILLFCLGFILPLSWFLASFLPIPLDPTVAPTPSQTDMEQHFTQQFGPADDKAFQKATWWRNLNRIMSVIGTVLIVAIIVLAVLLARKS